MWGRVQPTDAQIVGRVLAGSPDDFGLLVKRYLGVAHATAFAYSGNREDAEDIAQESFLRAYRFLHTLREPAKFCGWLNQIVRNTTNTHLENRRLDAYAQIPAKPAALVPDPARNEIRELLRQRILELEPEARQVLLLHYYVGQSTREIASLLGISRDAAKKRLSRARQSLSDQMIAELQPAVAPETPPETQTNVILLACLGANITRPALSVAMLANAAFRAQIRKIAVLAAGGLLVAGIAVAPFFRTLSVNGAAGVVGASAGTTTALDASSTPSDPAFAGNTALAGAASGPNVTPAALSAQSSPSVTDRALSVDSKTPQGVLALYAQNMDKIKGIRVKYKAEIRAVVQLSNYSFYNGSYDTFEEGAFSHDFSQVRTAEQSLRWGDLSKNLMGIPRGRARFTERLWDGEKSIQYIGDEPGRPGHGNIFATNVYCQNWNLLAGFHGGPQLGYPVNCRGDRLDKMMRMGTLSLRPSTEYVGTSNCLVVDSVSQQHGHIAAWFDPEKGYCTAKYEIVLGPGNWWGGGVSPQTMPKGTVTLGLYVLDFVQVSGVWIPRAARKTFEMLPDVMDDHESNDDSVEFSSIELNPDFDAQKTFVYAGKNMAPGTKWCDDRRPDMGQEGYIWANGQFVPNPDRKVESQQ